MSRSDAGRGSSAYHSDLGEPDTLYGFAGGQEQVWRHRPHAETRNLIDIADGSSCASSGSPIKGAVECARHPGWTLPDPEHRERARRRAAEERHRPPRDQVKALATRAGQPRHRGPEPVHGAPVRPVSGRATYGLGIAGPHIVILHVVVHMYLPCRDNSRPHRLLRDPLHKAARDWSAALEADHRTSGTGGRSAIATRLAQAPVIIIPDARSECESFGSPAIGREYDRTLSFSCRGGTRGTVISRAFGSRDSSPVAEGWVSRAGSGGSPTPGVLEPACHEPPNLAVEAVGSRATWRRTQPRRTATARPPVRGNEPEVWRDRPGRMRRRLPHRRSGLRRADPAGASAQSHAGRVDNRHRARRLVQSCFGS